MTDVLDLIGEQLQRAAQYQTDRLRAHPRSRRVTSWLFAPPHDGRRRSRWRSPRALGALLVAATVTAGGAYGAVRLIGVGSPAPPSNNPLFELYVGGRTQLLSVRAADPAGGPPWAIQLVREKNSPNNLIYGPSPALCVKIGRVLDGRIGVIGSYGAFHNDGLFHPASITSGLLTPSGCYIGSGTQPPTLNQITFAGDGELVANGLAGCKQAPLPVLLPPSAQADPPAEKKRIEQAVTRERHQAGLANERYDNHLLAELRTNGAVARALAKRRGVSVATLRAVVEYQLAQTRLALANKATSIDGDMPRKTGTKLVGRIRRQQRDDRDACA